ncbi:MAG: zinc ribbon domain-containing protein [Planctomycetota bacterium]
MSPVDYQSDEDGDLPQEQDLGGDSADLGEMVCPSCGANVTEDTQKCPHCGDWITPEYPSRHNWRRWVFVAVVLLMLCAILRWTF